MACQEIRTIRLEFPDLLKTACRGLLHAYGWNGLCAGKNQLDAVDRPVVPKAASQVTEVKRIALLAWEEKERRLEAPGLEHDYGRSQLIFALLNIAGHLLDRPAFSQKRHGKVAIEFVFNIR